VLVLVLSLAHAGYGDALDGHPTWEERAVHLWSNAARMDPTAFEDEYQQGGCSLDGFEAGQETPRPPLAWNRDLAAAARFHNDDMLANDFFSHTSSDGTSFGDRVFGFYQGRAIGENIAAGYRDGRAAVLSGWMCSPPHRRGLLGDYEELGAAARDRVYTQVFGARGASPRALNAVLHTPAAPGSTVTLWADAAGAVEGVVGVLDGEAHPMDLAIGAPDQGLYAVDVALEAPGGCHTWYAEVALTDGSVERVPEEGSLAFGDCDLDDPSGWVDRQVEPAPEDDPDDGDPGEDPGDDPGTGDADPGEDGATDGEGGDPGSTDPTGGCSTSPAPLTPLALLLGLLAVRRRR
jgi:MYXO-CTERM domain-containing protein